MLEIKNLYVGYGAFEVLHGIDLKIGKGQLVSLIGTNGAGKTTLLNTLAGIHRPTEGEVRFKGVNITAFRPCQTYQLGLAYMAEGHPIFQSLTVQENLELGGIAVGLSSRQQRNKFEEVYHLFPFLEQRLKQRAGTFSGGEQQLLSLARCLMTTPQLILCDEPTLGLAPFMVKELFRILKHLHTQGTTLLLVEQNVEQALLFCDEAFVLEQGRIILSGTGDELLKNPDVQRSYLGG
ncbi:ABC transporter ATP-binding protein [Candidatus Finniella inopinata]|uniref:ABC transporter ATP-binding protein n=1 Tax=Candidatus Finniella inopinata TaxID=1696036 RepID=A0A4Q7DJ83_9PROT|nr:ABC transporter ATP-binding protein [Candidatus Finniella inopinata]RZI46802.1 ABC transporter ATP-binding protein [Candidatus Finniella inopinata]